MATPIVGATGPLGQPMTKEMRRHPTGMSSARPSRTNLLARPALLTPSCTSISAQPRAHQPSGLSGGSSSSHPGPRSPRLLPLRTLRRLHNARTVVARAAAVAATAGAPEEGGDGAAATVKSSPLVRFLSIFNVFSDERCNSKLLALAIGQMLCSIATLIHDSYLPIYVHEELGLSTTKIGAVQGAAQFLCQISKGVSGVVGDILGSQTRVLVFGTLLTLACKPMFALLSTVYGIFGVTACLYWFFLGKLLDRLSKGIREAPTKAVMNELARESGDAPDAAYGLRQSLATAGMLIGSTIASLTFAATGNNYILTFTVASIPPALALGWLVANFRDEIFGPPRDTAVTVPPVAVPPPTAGAAAGDDTASPTPSKPAQTANILSVSVDMPTERSAEPALPPLTAAAPPGGTGAAAAAVAALPAPEPILSPLQKAVAVIKAFKPVYWQALAVVAVLYFARFDASFLSIRAKAVMPKTLLPMMTLVNTLIQMLLTAPLARVSGASVANRNRLLLVGFGFMVAADTCFASPLTANPAGMFLGSAFIGLHMAMTHAITISMVSSYMPTGVLPGVGKLSGTAVSFTDLLLGFVLAASNAVAGILTDSSRAAGLGNVGCFMGGAAACVLSGLLLVLFERFGDLGRDDLVVKRTRKKGTGGAAPVALTDPAMKAKPE